MQVEEHMVDGKLMKLLVHRKGSTRAFPPHHPLIPVDYQFTGAALTFVWWLLLLLWLLLWLLQQHQRLLPNHPPSGGLLVHWCCCCFYFVAVAVAVAVVVVAAAAPAHSPLTNPPSLSITCS